MDIKLLGEQIKSARKMQGLSLKSLSKMSGVHYSQISRMERGAGVLVSKNMQKVCELLNVAIGPASSASKVEELSQKVQNLIHEWPGSEDLIRKFVDVLEAALADGAAKRFH
ncbi:hypothetical protein APA59_33755 [Pseudomonas aeruginosa]|nr:hypothetical protein APA59_33755 [Pseudomonas aeruginosa]